MLQVVTHLLTYKRLHRSTLHLYYSIIGVAGARRPLTLLNSRSLIICAISPWITSIVVLHASLVALPSLSSVRFS